MLRARLLPGILVAGPTSADGEPNFVPKLLSKGSPISPWSGSLASLKGSELWAPVLKVVSNGIIMRLYGFRTRGPYYTLLCHSVCHTIVYHAIVYHAKLGTHTFGDHRIHFVF